MSNAYNDWKKDMETYTRFFKRDNKFYKGICYNDDYCTDGINYEFCDLIVNDAIIHNKFSHNEDLPPHEKEELVKFENYFKFIIVQVGTSSRNSDGTYDENYEKTLYIFHNDWLMSDGKDLFVVDAQHIKEWTEITEQKFAKIKKEG